MSVSVHADFQHHPLRTEISLLSLLLGKRTGSESQVPLLPVTAGAAAGPMQLTFLVTIFPNSSFAVSRLYD